MRWLRPAYRFVAEWRREPAPRHLDHGVELGAGVRCDLGGGDGAGRGGAMTQLAQALRAAGVVTVEERLRDIAVQVLAAHGSSRIAAANAMYARVRHEPDLLEGLFAPYRELALRRLLGGVESEMRREEIARQEKAQGEGHIASGDHAGSAFIARPGGGHKKADDRAQAAPVQPDRRAAQESVGKVLRLTMLDTFRIDGTPIGDVQAGAARAWARREGRHVRWVTMLTSNVPAADPIRRWITPEDADEMWSRSVEDADA